LDTSITARVAVAALIFGFVCIIAWENLRTLFLLILRRKINRFSRYFWLVMALFVVFCVVDAFYIEPDWVQLTNHTIHTGKLPKGAKLRIVQISDIHMDDFDGREETMIRLTANSRPDIILLTGDYLNLKKPRGYAALTLIGKKLAKIAPTYAVAGNWDYPADMAALEKAGVKSITRWDIIPTRNKGRIALGYLWWSMPADVVDIPPNIEGLYKVLLCHRPDTFDSAARKGIDLMLSGHTHGGQVRVPVFGALLPLPDLVGKYQAGLYSKGNSALYVSRGIGTESLAPAVRFCCRPEVAVIDIVGK
jgi:predicted MPP superfamily phosphohydrolase